ncbi:MAG: cytochrome c [SAR324 cluster bacterium]|nr:cytochrome c [SAR324 cluster bacterium]
MLKNIFFGLLIFSGSLLFAAEPLYNVPDAPAEYAEMTNAFTSQKDLEIGKKYYQKECADCHGESGEGDADDKSVVAFTNSAWMNTRSDGQLFYIAAEGAGEDSDMEAYGPWSEMGYSEKRVWQMISYIRTLIK